MNVTTTENGAPAFASTLDPRLNLFFKTVRDIPVVTLIALFKESWDIDKLDTLKILFNWRDCRGGKGDYAGFIQVMAHMANDPSAQDWLVANLDLLPTYGRYLDWVKLWHLSPPDIRARIMTLVVDQVNADLDAHNHNRPISLLSKWLPSENGHHDARDNQDRFVIAFCKQFYDTPRVARQHLKMYRTQVLVPLRHNLNIIETHLCDQTLDQVDYSKVPSLAMTKYRKAFTKQPNFQAYLGDLRDNTTTINAEQTYPHDLVRHYLRCGSYDEVIEQQWKVLKQKVADTQVFQNALIVCDVSGSMSGTPMEVAIALGLLGMQEDHQLITFSETPKIHKVAGTTLEEQVKSVRGMHWGRNTNFDRVMDLVLATCAAGKVVRRIFVFSDMQFDQAFDDSNATHFQHAQNKFADLGLTLPRIVFWNLRESTDNVSVTCNENGVTLLSGYSPSLLQMLLNTEDITPLKAMFDIIHSPRYDLIRPPLPPPSPQDTPSGRYNYWQPETA